MLWAVIAVYISPAFVRLARARASDRICVVSESVCVAPQLATAEKSVGFFSHQPFDIQSDALMRSH